MHFNRKMLKKIIITAAAAYLLTVFIIAPVYNAVYVKAALEKYCHGMEITGKEEYNGGWGGLFGTNDIPYHYLRYELYDRQNDISFTQRFSRLRLLPFYAADKHDIEKYTFILNRKNFRQELIDTVNRDYAEPLGGFAVLNPFDGEYANGFHIFLPKISSAQTQDLTVRLREFTNKKRGESTYISYSVYICEDNGTFEKIKNTDLSSASAVYTGQGCFSDMLEPAGIAGEEVYSSSEGFDPYAYQSCRDETYAHYIWYYSGEPNASRHERFSLFGVEYDVTAQ